MDLDFDVVELSEPDHPATGETAPNFERPLVNNEFWEDITLEELTAEGPVVLVFHPMDGAFPATYIWNELQDRGFDSYDAIVVGLSISTPYEHKSFIEDRDLAKTGFKFFSDPANDIAEQYGVANDLDGMAGIAEPRPAVFVIDEERTVEYAWAAREHPEFPDYDEFQAEVERVVDG